jgi:predicted lysophospholipase L1 biosynthesis ABC-type transport system permease subunit
MAHVVQRAPAVTRTLILAELRRRWLEYLLAALAVAAVVAALIAHRAVTQSAESSVHELAHRLGKNMLVVPAAADLEAFHAGRPGREALPDSMKATIAASPLAQHVRGMQLRLHGEVEVGGAAMRLVGDDGFSPQAASMNPAPAVLGPAAARRLGVDRGGTFQVAGRGLSVLDVADPAPDGLDDAIFVPLPIAQLMLQRPGEISAARLAGCWCSIDVAALGTEIEKLLPGSRAITVAGTLAAQKGSVAEMNRWSGPMYAAGAVLVTGLVAALVASQARRRTNELGLLVAIGAPPARVAFAFVAQSAVLGAIAGAIGWALAVPASRWVGERVLGTAVSPPAGLFWTAVAIAAVVSAVASSIPALRAAAQDPTVVLRES